MNNYSTKWQWPHRDTCEGQWSPEKEVSLPRWSGSLEEGLCPWTGHSFADFSFSTSLFDSRERRWSCTFCLHCSKAPTLHEPVHMGRLRPGVSNSFPEGATALFSPSLFLEHRGHSCQGLVWVHDLTRNNSSMRAEKILLPTITPVPIYPQCLTLSRCLICMG